MYEAHHPIVRKYQEVYRQFTRIVLYNAIPESTILGKRRHHTQVRNSVDADFGNPREWKGREIPDTLIC